MGPEGGIAPLPFFEIVIQNSFFSNKLFMKSNLSIEFRESIARVSYTFETLHGIIHSNEGSILQDRR